MASKTDPTCTSFMLNKKPELAGDSVFPNAEGDVGTCRACVGLTWAFEDSWELIPSRIWGGTPKGEGGGLSKGRL